MPSVTFAPAIANFDVAIHSLIRVGSTRSGNNYQQGGVAILARSDMVGSLPNLTETHGNSRLLYPRALGVSHKFDQVEEKRRLPNVEALVCVLSRGNVAAPAWSHPPTDAK